MLASDWSTNYGSISLQVKDRVSQFWLYNCTSVMKSIIAKKLKLKFSQNLTISLLLTGRHDHILLLYIVC